MSEPAAAIRRAAELFRQADGLIVAAGAGMGVDSGLPDFRGTQGFWQAYPALGRARIEFERIANPAAFTADPRLAWGFYGHRLNLYRQTVPHEGFTLLRQIGEQLEHGVFVFTSNVDGQFQKAGFDAKRILEVHGSIHHLQCTIGCSAGIWSAADFHPDIDDEACRLLSPLPKCPSCGELARPNILMFGDWSWLAERTRKQEAALDQWFDQLARPVIIEIGAGEHVPTVRFFSETTRGALIRINPTAPDIPNPNTGVSLCMNGLQATREIVAALGSA
jgi:NAD-dependent SIR2 family protein deacetylase